MAFAIACSSEEDEPTPVATTAAASAPTAVVAEPVAATPDYWNPPTAFYGEPVYGGHLRINYEDPLEHANLWGAHSGVTVRYRMPMMNSLVAEDPNEPGRIIPDLAKSWVQDDDLQGITFTFEDGIKWHNGEDFACEDARFTIETMITGEGLTASEMAGKLSFIDNSQSSCEGEQLKLRFNGPSATPLLAFTDRAFLIFNKAWFVEGGEDVMFNDVSLGTGPFKWAAGQSVGVDEQVFEKNMDYFKPGLPYVDQVTVFGILSESTQLTVMLARQTDWHWVRNFGQYDAYVENDQIQTVIRATRGHHSIWLNKGRAPFDNVNVRQAIFMGIDRGAGITVLLDGHGSQGFIMPPGGPWDLDQAVGCAIPGWCEPSGGYEAQRAEAIKLLEAENFPFDETFTFTVEADEQVQARATFIQEQLRLLGVKTDFDLIETVAF
ncbi:MAG: ABC transporter substrate-binding protein, partial [Chloroflexi bacterium]|nr:ABC transporter substrate-binding protein [Chloroflexota bacterium]